MLIWALTWSLAGKVLAQSGWAASPILVLPTPTYSVLGPQPGCSGEVRVDPAIRRWVEGSGRAAEPELTSPTWLSRTIGETLNFLGMGTVLQTFATCSEVCATIPLEATQVTSLIGYVAIGSTAPFAPLPFGRWEPHFRWGAEVDTTRSTEAGRLICVEARNWAWREETRVFLVVGFD